MNFSTILNIIIVLLAVWFIYTRIAPIKGLKNMSAKDFQQSLHHPGAQLVIDVREPFEYKQGFIPGAKNIPLSQLESRMNELQKDKEIFLYCRSGMRSKQAGKLLIKHGFIQLAHLQGGISAWKGKISN
ncbi:rhodanese-like domain-containing protein [Paenibacillus sp. LMG 31456]|uniref:Rhodanese-like domain-containing protein n=1 Tax=Paenibacillus foliorum TaxID=2654974 RepID=A0A972GNC4_9BACL|nr:rhodanese-like domain-containing protein [Paenibacillus foliorum]NOU93185.1 rhodanese-like domain-containing protein [Paenibacillus foliorum]